MKVKKGAKRLFRIIFITAVVIILVGVGILCYKRFFDKGKEVVKPEIVDKLDDYGYSLEKDATKLDKEMFAELKKTLNVEEVDEEKYASLVAKMLVADFYNLDNKVSKNDIGGVQFIKEDYRNNFIFEASETVYKYIELNVYNDRTQELPVVSSVDIKSINTTTYKYKDITDSKAYKAVVTVSYEKDLGYPKEVTVVMIHNKDNEKKLEVIKMY